PSIEGDGASLRAERPLEVLEVERKPRRGALAAETLEEVVVTSAGSQRLAGTVGPEGEAHAGIIGLSAELAEIHREVRPEPGVDEPIEDGLERVERLLHGLGAERAARALHHRGIAVELEERAERLPIARLHAGRLERLFERGAVLAGDALHHGGARRLRHGLERGAADAHVRELELDAREA